MKALLVATLLLILASAALAQGFTKFDCALGAMNFDSDNPEVVRKQAFRELGSFKVDGVGEEERITRFFRLPKTKWFVVASLFSTDESMGSRSGPDSFTMELSLSRRRKRNIVTSPGFADSEMPFNTFDIARVSMIVKAGDHRQMVIMECRGSK